MDDSAIVIDSAFWTTAGAILFLLFCQDCFRVRKPH